MLISDYKAIINSLTHRDYYDKGAVTTVEVFDDRVEITNPGGLVSAISEKEFGKRSHSRNPLIFGLFARMNLVEQVGSGIGRIKDLMKKAELPKPVFQKKGIFTVIFTRPLKTTQKTDLKSTQNGSQKSSQKTVLKILQLINDNKAITTTEMGEKLEITRREVAKHIAKLKNQGLIKRIGSDKSGTWLILKNNEKE